MRSASASSKRGAMGESLRKELENAASIKSGPWALKIARRLLRRNEFQLPGSRVQLSLIASERSHEPRTPSTRLRKKSCEGLQGAP